MAKKRVLFVCVHNSARGQMAEAWLRHLYPEDFEVYSAGGGPGTLNPLAVEVMREVGIDISHHQPKSVEMVLQKGLEFDYIITVCDDSAEQCPVVPGPGKRSHWSFPDPSSFTGPWEERKEKVRRVRDAIRRRIEAWYQEIHGTPSNADVGQ